MNNNFFTKTREYLIRIYLLLKKNPLSFYAHGVFILLITRTFILPENSPDGPQEEKWY